MRNRRPNAFTVIEVLVVIGIIGVLMAILLPAAERVRHQAYIDKCASNLRQIGLAIATYESDNHGNYPRTLADETYTKVLPTGLTKGTGIMAADPFQGGVGYNDLTAPLFLVLKSQRVTPEVFICPYNDETDFSADTAPIAGRSNFTNYKKNLGYSFANPYGNTTASAAGYRLCNKLSAEFAIAADLNPGVDATTKKSDVYAARPNSPTSVMQKANSANHERDGQNVLYGDGHVAWQITPLCGVQQDNIYTAKNGVTPNVELSPADATDSILLPSDD